MTDCERRKLINDLKVIDIDPHQRKSCHGSCLNLVFQIQLGALEMLVWIKLLSSLLEILVFGSYNVSLLNLTRKLWRTDQSNTGILALFIKLLELKILRLVSIIGKYEDGRVAFVHKTSLMCVYTCTETVVHNNKAQHQPKPGSRARTSPPLRSFSFFYAADQS